MIILKKKNEKLTSGTEEAVYGSRHGACKLRVWWGKKNTPGSGGNRSTMSCTGKGEGRDRNSCSTVMPGKPSMGGKGLSPGGKNADDNFWGRTGTRYGSKREATSEKLFPKRAIQRGLGQPFNTHVRVAEKKIQAPSQD